MEKRIYGKLNFENESGWAIVSVHPSITFYYRKVIEWIYFIKLRPILRPHITVIAGKYEDLTKHELWGEGEGEKVYFTYNGFTKEDGYWWVKIKDDSELREIRRKFGLNDTPKYPFHLTIGREQ